LIRAVNAAARAGAVLAAFLLVLGVLRWSPVFARAAFGGGAMEAGAALVLCAVAAALAGRERAPRAARLVPAFAAALAVVAIALGAVTAARPAAGLSAVVAGRSGPVGNVARGPVDVIGRDLRADPVRRLTVRWEGPLRVPESGVYRLWAAGRGEVHVVIDGRTALRGAGDALRAGADAGLTRGAHALEVTLVRVGPGPRLRLGWTRPDGVAEPIPPRSLGPEIARAWWVATDVLSVLAALLVAALAWALPWDVRRPPVPPTPFAAREIAWSAFGHAAIVAALSWPLVLDLAGQGVTDRPDGRLNAWILAWDAHALARAPGRLFDAPAFHPLKGALAFSENLLLPSIVAAPFQALGGPVLAYNAVLLLALVASGLAAQALARNATGDRWAAFVAGAFFAAGAHRWVRLAHLHAQVTMFLPLVLFAFDRFWRERTGRRALAVGLLLALQALSSVYLGAITAAALAAAIAVALLGGLPARALRPLTAALALAALVLAPVAWPYFRMRALHGVEFALDAVATYATTLESYAASGTRLYGALTQRHLDPERVQDTLFPGLTVLLLGLSGLAAAPRRYRWVAVAASALAVVLSLGPETALYRWLHEHVVLVRAVRALSRFSLVPVLALSVLAAFALARRPRLAAAALALFALESSNAPMRYAPAPRPPAAALALAGRGGAAVVLPLGEDDTRVMLDGLAHLRPLVNGDSGFMPRPYSRAMELLQPPLDEEAWRFLRAVDVRDVVWGGRADAVPAGERAVIPAPGALGGPTSWSRDGIVVDLGALREVRRVVFVMGDTPWVASPRVEASLDGRTWTPVPGATARLGDAVLALYADPRGGRGEVRFAPYRARWLRLDPALPARPPLVWAD
jgi:hypothetical protein